jgi:DNA (cytosine-5)-methyltransferase 1
VIGGPPCQFASLARHGAKKEAVNLIPEYLRIVDEAGPTWAVMENVRQVSRKGCAPPWPWTDLRDADCGGLTNRVRRFWFHGIPPPLVGRPMPNPRSLGGALHSVLATDWHGRTLPDGQYVRMSAEEAARRQGYPELAQRIMAAQPGEVPPGARRVLAIHMLGNGVPRAMGLYLARHVRQCVEGSPDRRAERA